MADDFYVYAWLRPNGEPFYIGKGTGPRAWVYKAKNPIFDRIVKKIIAAGGEPTIQIIHKALDERAAFGMERDLILKHGRINNRTGILANMTDGGGGTSGKVVSAATRTKMSILFSGRPCPERTRLAVARSNATRDWDANSRARMSRAACASAPKGKYKGVVFYKRTGRWMAQINTYGKYRPLGYFATPEEAARAYDKAAFAAWGRDCYLNFPAELAAFERRSDMSNTVVRSP